MPFTQAYSSDSIFANGELRLDSFKNWPPASPVGAAALAKAGLFYTGESGAAPGPCRAPLGTPHLPHEAGPAFIYTQQPPLFSLFLSSLNHKSPLSSTPPLGREAPNLKP